MPTPSARIAHLFDTFSAPPIWGSLTNEPENNK